MKKLFFLPLFLFAFAVMSQAQLVAKANARTYGLLASLNEIPAMPVQDGSGNKYKLNQYIRDNRLHPDKPILVFTWYTFCRGCMAQLDSMSSGGFGDRFNIVTVLLKFAKSETPENKSLEEYINKDGVKRNWSKFINLESLDTAADRHLWNGQSTPLFLFADKNMKIYHHYISYSKEMVPAANDILTRIDKGTYGFQPGKLYYDKIDRPVAPTSPDAVRYIHSYRSGGYLYVQSISKIDSSKILERFIERNREFINDGVFQDFDEKGKLTMTRSFKNGAWTETFRQTDALGRLQAIVPVNGTAKRFDDNGFLTLEGPMKDGLGEGLFKQYKDGKLTSEVMLKQGNYDGVSKVYEDGELVSTEYYEKGKKVEKK